MRRRMPAGAGLLLAIAVTVLLALASVFTSAFAIAGSALIMGGSSHPLSVPEDSPKFINKYVSGADTDYIAPSGLCGPTCSLIAVYTPEQFKFVTGLFDMTFDESVAVGQANLNDCLRGNACTVTLAPYTETGSATVADNSYVVYAYSESSAVATQQKLALIAHPVPSTVDFLMLANPNRPNGGILQRFVGLYIPILGVTFNGATPTFSPQPAPLTTVDIARQYDGWTDFPTNPLNLLSDSNALIGTILVHGNYFGVGTPQLQGQYQDTTYYLIPTPVVPLLMPLTWVPLVGKPLAIALDPAMRVLIEMGYDRTINPGQPTAARYFYVPNLFRAAVDFAVAIPTGWDDAISYLTGDPDCRPFHTKVPTSPYGVGGPPVYAGAVDPYGEPTPALAQPNTGNSATAGSNTVSPDTVSGSVVIPDMESRDLESLLPTTELTMPVNTASTETGSDGPGRDVVDAPAVDPNAPPNLVTQGSPPIDETTQAELADPTSANSAGDEKDSKEGTAEVSVRRAEAKPATESAPTSVDAIATDATAADAAA